MSTTLIIDRPSLIPPHKRILFGVATLAIWSLWLYLWLPLTTLIGWVIGGFIGYQQMVVLDGYADLIRLLSWYALIVLLMGGALVIWATYNLLRFRGKERRIPLQDVSVKTYGLYFGVAADDLIAWRQTKILAVHHSEEGSLQHVDMHTES
jgi:biofilm PGA synthesis protein PgaD